jgi:putative glutamine amidotransferase
MEPARWGPWDKAAVLLPATYVHAVEAAGGRAIVVPPSIEGAGEVIGSLDGLVCSGGSDLDPSMYGHDPHPETGPAKPVRDAGEAPLLETALDFDLPVLAICRGMQLLNVLAGGTLEQHLPDRTGEIEHRLDRGQYVLHDVSIRPDSRLGEILGDCVQVNSHHHQAPDKVGTGLVDVAWTPDGTIEGLEEPSAHFVVGVQWHPEEGDGLALFDALIEAAR